MTDNNREINLVLPVSQVGIIVMALGEMAAKNSMDTIINIRSQVDRQLSEHPAPPPNESEN